MKTVIGQQGEVPFFRIPAIPAGVTTKPHMERVGLGVIISHSEKGNHHVLTGGDVLEKTSDVPAGMRIFYAILDAPQRFIQDAQVPHESFDLPAGLYEFRISREYDPFAEQARRVAD